MKRIAYFLILASAHCLSMSSSQDEVLVITIHALCDLDMQPDTLTLTLDSADTGAIIPAVDSGDYAIVTNENADFRITASIDVAMPTDTTLNVVLDAPGVGTTTGPQVMTTNETDMVTGIRQVAIQGVLTEYQFSAEVTAAIGSFTRVVTYTLSNS